VTPLLPVPPPLFILFTPRTAPLSLARSLARLLLARLFARADYNRGLQRCRRSSWTAAAAWTGTVDPGRRDRDPPAGPEPGPAVHHTFSIARRNVVVIIVIVQVSSRPRQWCVKCELRYIRYSPLGRPSYPRVLSTNLVTSLAWSRAAPSDERSSTCIRSRMLFSRVPSLFPCVSPSALRIFQIDGFAHTRGRRCEHSMIPALPALAKRHVRLIPSAGSRLIIRQSACIGKLYGSRNTLEYMQVPTISYLPHHLIGTRLRTLPIGTAHPRLWRNFSFLPLESPIFGL